MDAKIVNFKNYVPTVERGDVLAGSWGISAPASAAERARQHDCFTHLFIVAVLSGCTALMLVAGYFLGAALLAASAGFIGLMARRQWKELIAYRIDDAWWEGHTNGRRQMMMEMQEQGFLR